MSSDILVYNTTDVTPVFATNATIASNSAIQATPLDFGTPRAATWLCRLNAAMSAAPTAGKRLDVYVGWSSVSNGGLPAQLGTLSGAYTISGGTLGTQLEYVGALVLKADTILQTQDIGVVMPKRQFGAAVIVNNSDQSVGSATVLSMTFTPIVDQVQ